MKGVFVTGTGTEVGKTVVAAVIARTAASGGASVGVFKPAVSGLDDYAGGRELPDHELLQLASGSDQTADEIAPYRYAPPVSPHLAAELAGEAIDPARLVAAARAAGADGRYLVCEGVGGILVPLTSNFAERAKSDHGARKAHTRRYLVRDLARELGLPVVVVASPGLGTINHTLLTLEAVRAAGLAVAAVALTPWPGEPSPMERSNRETIERLGEVTVLTLEHVDVAAPETWPPLSVQR